MTKEQPLHQKILAPGTTVMTVITNVCERLLAPKGADYPETTLPVCLAGWGHRRERLAWRGPDDSSGLQWAGRVLWFTLSLWGFSWTEATAIHG